MPISLTSAAFGISDAETASMVEELIVTARVGMANALNLAAEQVMERAQVEVPKSMAHKERTEADYPWDSLADNAEVVDATPESLEAAVVFHGPYAGAQEAGEMMYVSRSGKEVEWQATQYTTPGTKAHYLEDAGKSIAGEGNQIVESQTNLIFEKRV